MNWFRVKTPIRARHPESFVEEITMVVLLVAEELYTALGDEVTREHLYLQDVLFQAAQVCFPDVFYPKIPSPGGIEEKPQRRVSAQFAARIASYPEYGHKLYSIVEPLEWGGVSTTEVLPVPDSTTTNQADSRSIRQYLFLYALIESHVTSLVGFQSRGTSLSTEAVEEVLRCLRHSGDSGRDSAEMFQKSKKLPRLYYLRPLQISLIRHIIAGFLTDRVFGRHGLDLSDGLVGGLTFIENSVVNRGKFLVCWRD